MNIRQFYELADRKGKPQPDLMPVVKPLVAKYPYFQAGLFLYLKLLYTYNRKVYEKEMLRLSLFINDRKALFYYIRSADYSPFLDAKQVAPQTPKNPTEQKIDRTAQILDRYFAENPDDETENLDEIIRQAIAAIELLPPEIGETDPDAEHDIPPIIVETEAVKDEPEFVHETMPPVKPPEKVSKQKKSRTDELIDRFIEKTEESGGDVSMIGVPLTHEEREPEVDLEDIDDEIVDDDDVFFTETLADTFIRNHQYTRAKEALERICRNYPQKRPLYAEKLQYLDKLIRSSAGKG
jgi:hypothetical protein